MARYVGSAATTVPAAVQLAQQGLKCEHVVADSWTVHRCDNDAEKQNLSVVLAIAVGQRVVYAAHCAHHT